MLNIIYNLLAIHLKDCAYFKENLTHCIKIYTKRQKVGGGILYYTPPPKKWKSPLKVHFKESIKKSPLKKSG